MTDQLSTSSLSPTGSSRRSADREALLAARLRRAGRPPAPALIPRREQVDPPLSYAQERLWFMEQYAPGTAAYTIPLARRLCGPLDPAALERALRQVTRRHEALRTRFPATHDGRPVAVVEADAEPALRTASAGSREEARQLVETELALPVDSSQAPLLHALLVRVGPEEHVLVLRVHHLACDGWSAELLLRELLTLADGAVEEPEPTVRYGDFAAWQRGGRDAGREASDLEYWLPRLAGVPPLNLPPDHPRPARQTFRGAAHSFSLGRDTSRRVTELASTHAATPFMVLLTAFQLLLGRFSGQRDFAVGTPVAGRTRPELDDVVGCFVNMLALRAELDPERSFAQQLQSVRADTLDAFAHQELPFERLVTKLDPVRDTSRSPVFQVLFALQNYASGTAGPAPAVTAEVYPVTTWAARFDLELYLVEGPDGFHGQIVHNTDCFTAATAQRLARAYTTLLAAATATPDTPAADLPLLDRAGRQAALAAGHGAQSPDLRHRTLSAWLDHALTGDRGRIAVTAEEGSLTRGELVDRARRVSHALRAYGAGPGTVVAVHAERSLDLVTALLGVLGAGAAYLPLDPEYPPGRLSYMVQDSGAPLLLTQRRLAAQAPSAPHTLLLDDLVRQDPSGGAPPPLDADPLDPAYAIYTSGSTGRPKGVLVPHAAICNRLDWMQRTYALTAGDTVLQKTPAGFDVSVWEFFWPLLAGARLVLARPGGHKDPAYLRDVIAAERVTAAHFVPSMLSVFVEQDGIEACTDLRLVVCSGEELPPALAARLHRRLDVRLDNLYGPTEAAVDVSWWTCPPQQCEGSARLPIGVPIQNTRLHVLDERGRPVPDGMPGQLHIAGVPLALGYLGRPGATADRFRPDPYGPPGTRMYATGDLALRREDGALEFLGRIDRQVKLRGVRIEPGEIEAALTALPEVRDAAVIVREDRPGDQRLVAYVTAADGDDARPQPPCEPARLRAALKDTLPDLLVPAAYVTLDRLPLTPSGKLDRAALPPPTLTRAAGSSEAPAPGVQEDIARIWRDVLDVPRVGLDDDFFDLGGHSLLATQVVARMRTALGAGVSVLDLFQHPTVRELADLAGTPAADRGPTPLLHELTRRAATDPAPRLTLVCVPFGGGSAVVYQPVADALPRTHRLLALQMPGHDVGRDEDPLPFDELVERCADEILERVSGPLALYGHCAIGSAVAVELARRLEAAGRHLEAVYVGGIFPFARPRSRAVRWLSALARRDALTGNRVYENWLRGLGLELGDLDQEQAHRIVRTMRRDSEDAEARFTELLHRGVPPVSAPVVSVVGDRDPATDYAEERYREWHFLSPRTALVVLDEAGHFFLKYRAEEVAQIVAEVHVALAEGTTARLHGARDHRTWWLQAESTAPVPSERTDGSSSVPTAAGAGTATGGVPAPETPPDMRRFLAVAAGQTVSLLGSALTEFAVPLWIFLHTGSVARFALLTVLALVPGLLIAPIAGAVVDRTDRKRVMLAGDLAAGGVQGLFALLAASGHLTVTAIYAFAMVLSVALTFQRLAYGSSIPQLVPKQYLGHANGLLQIVGGTSSVLAPLLATALLALIGLDGILALDVTSYAVAVAVTAAIRFPNTMPWRRRETLGEEIRQGLRHSWGNRGLRSMLLFFAVLNIFLSPLFLLLTPLTLSFAHLADAGRVSLCAGLGAVAGGLVMGFWGGPRHQRMRGVLLSALALACCSAVPGLSPHVWTVALGAFAMCLALGVMNGIYFTTVQVKVAQRFHGRVFALNTVVSWSTLPLAFGVVAPLGSRLLNPLLTRHGALAGSVGRVLGTGPGRGTALLYVLFALAMVAVVAVSLRLPALRTFDARVPDAPPDDLVGLRILADRENHEHGPARPAGPHDPPHPTEKEFQPT